MTTAAGGPALTREVMAPMTPSRQAVVMTSFGATLRVVRFEPVERLEQRDPAEQSVQPRCATTPPAEQAAPVVV